MCNVRANRHKGIILSLSDMVHMCCTGELTEHACEVFKECDRRGIDVYAVKKEAASHIFEDSELFLRFMRTGLVQKSCEFAAEQGFAQPFQLLRWYAENGGKIDVERGYV